MRPKFLWFVSEGKFVKVPLKSKLEFRPPSPLTTLSVILVLPLPLTSSGETGSVIPVPMPTLPLTNRSPSAANAFIPINKKPTNKTKALFFIFLLLFNL